MTAEIAEFVRFSNLRPGTDGTRFAVQIEYADGSARDVSFTVQSIGDIIEYLLRAANLTAERQVPVAGQTFYWPRLPAEGMGVAPGQTAATWVLTVTLGTVVLAFESPSTIAATLAAALNRTLVTLSADHTKQN